MKVNEVISKLRVMLGATTEVVAEVPTNDEDRGGFKFAEATLIDGTEVYTEGELEVGATLYIKVAEGEEAPFAPESLHETQDGLLVTVGENGEIISIEEKAQEAPAEESLETEEEIIVEEAMEEEEVKEEEAMEEEEKEEEATFDAEGLIEAIAEMIKPQAEELKDLKEKLATLQARFNEVADEPAAKPVKNTFSQVAQDKRSKAEARIEHIISLRKGK